ncbi:invasion associated locus B family protein [Aquamicrobium lusatiense]|uniref:invasion associated locus B family protein n=1 Tax=Aquamicrobium lusatiense TaxID=89772 RepID=UPI002457017C|nr:invasion associated locus B family protein [Aquamicrobium lusatiense]MDH4990682.1 invasion associated locus B family protein [Aquamicrobium lusatiense]
MAEPTMSIRYETKDTPMPHRIPTPSIFASVVTALLLSGAPSLAQETQPAAKGDRALAETAVQDGNKPVVSLPNGASSINETYGDWTINCAIADRQKRCGFSQEQGNSQTGQRLFAIELQPPADGQTNGVLLLPFGLKLDDGVKLKLDEQNLGQGARFSTCVPAGCLVPVSFPTVATDAMKKGEKLIVTATRDGGGEAPTFIVSLAGFTAALNRISDLAR